MRTPILAPVVSLLLLAAAQAQHCDGWVPIGEPAGKFGHALTYDSARGVAVLFGGHTRPLSSSQPMSDTWEYDGRGWRFRTLDGPSPRAGAAIAYDALRQRTVLFGGSVHISASNYLPSAETWEWDGQVWTERSIAGPPARWNAAMHYDPARQYILLYGGWGGGTATYTYDGQAWTEIPNLALNPGVMNTSTMTWDPTRQSVVLQGQTQTWAWNGVAWQQLPSSGTALSIAYSTSRSAVIGVEGLAQGRTFELSPSGWVQVPVPAANLIGAQIIEHTVLGRLMTVGSPVVLPDSGVANGHNLTAQGWQPRRNRDNPPAPSHAAMTFDAGRGMCVLAGGSINSITALPEHWELRGETWVRRGPLPFAPSITMAMAYDPTVDASILTLSSGTWRWDGQQWTNLGPGVDAYVAAYHPGLGVVTARGLLNIFDGAQWTPVNTGIFINEMPIAYDAGRGTLAANGGMGTPGTYLLQGLSFVQLSPQQTGYWGPSMAYDPGRGGLVCFGGFSSGFPRSTYFLGSSTTEWTTLPFRGPTGRKYASMVYDSLGERIVYFGGTDHSTYFRETWKLARGPTALARQPAATTAHTGQSTQLFLIAKGGGWLDYQWRKGGVPLEDGGRISGAYRDTLTISDVEPGDAGSYDCVVSGPCGTVTSDAAILTVNCYANCDGSTSTPALNVADFTCFLQQFASGNAYANCDRSTAPPVLNVADFTCFLQSFAAGCP